MRYSREATVRILLLKTTRAGAILIGKGLGTVEDWVRNYMVSRGVFGTSVLWFEKDPDNTFRQPDQYREVCMAAANTRDLPPILGYPRAYHLEVQDKLGILPISSEKAERGLAADITSATRVLYDLGLVESQTPIGWELILGPHRFVCTSPTKLSMISLVDAVGDIRTQSQPGTNNEYPNWRVPLMDSQGHPLKIEGLEYYVGIDEICQCVRETLRKDLSSGRHRG